MKISLILIARPEYYESDIPRFVVGDIQENDVKVKIMFYDWKKNKKHEMQPKTQMNFGADGVKMKATNKSVL